MSAASSQKDTNAIQASNAFSQRSTGASCAWKCPDASSSCSSEAGAACGSVVIVGSPSGECHCREAGNPASCVKPHWIPAVGDDAFLANRGPLSRPAPGQLRHLICWILSQSAFEY